MNFQDRLSLDPFVPPTAIESASIERLKLDAEDLVEMLPPLFHLLNYSAPHIDEERQFAKANKRDDNGERSELALIVKWWHDEEAESLAVGWAVYDTRFQRGRSYESGKFGEALHKEVNRVQSEPAHGNEEVVIAPGEPISASLIRKLRGHSLRDYSACATEEELADLYEGNLPLGCYAFGKSHDKVRHGRMLYLSKFSTGAPMEYNGALIVAPINRGKTQLIIRWAVAANQAGYSTFIVDVKGNLYEKLRHKLKGQVYYFTTDEDISGGDGEPGDVVPDRINFLCDLKWYSVKDRRRIKQFVATLLPSKGWKSEGGEAEMRYHLRAKYLNALIHILKLYHVYYRHTAFPGRSPDLGDLYDLANNEKLLYLYIKKIRVAEEANLKKGRTLPPIRVDHWVNEVAVLIDSKKSGIEEGQRDPTKGYLDYTIGVLDALEPFARHGALYPKICDNGPGRLFSLEDMGKEEQVTIILAAREQDGNESEAIVSMAITRLEQFLFERFKKSNPRPVLLLLDETRRIRSFKPHEYVTFAREAKAGCVLVYQSLEQIPEDHRKELIENVGTQIYLGPLSGSTAEIFLKNIKERDRPYLDESYTSGPSGRSRTVNAPRKYPYFNTAELAHLPAGNWPALIYIRDHKSGKPFLVDMDEAVALEQAIISSPLAASSAADQVLSISAAVKNGRAGDRIVVKPGRYVEDIVIDKEVEIVGDGPVEEIIIESSHSACIHMRAKSARIRGITLRGVAKPAAGEGFAVEITYGKLILENCQITSPAGSCIAVHGADSQPEVRHCQISQARRAGLRIWDKAGGTFENCCLFENGADAVEVSEAANPNLIKCQIHATDQQNAVVVQDAAGKFEHCEISGGAVDLKPNSQPRLRRCSIHGGRSSGVLISADSDATFDDCEIRSQDQAAVQFLGAGKAVFKDCQMLSPKFGGVTARPGASATLENCKIDAVDLLTEEALRRDTRLVLKFCQFEPKPQLEFKDMGDVKSMALSPDGRFALLSSDFGSIHRLNLESRKIDADLKGLGLGNIIAILSDSRRAIIDQPDGYAGIYDLEERKLLHTFWMWAGQPPEEARRGAARVSTPDGFSLSADGQYALFKITYDVWVRDVLTGEEVNRFSGFGKVWNAAISPDGQSVLIGSLTGAFLLNAETGERLVEVPHFYRGEHTEFYCTAFTPDGGFAVTGGACGNLCFMDLRTGELVRRNVIEPATQNSPIVTSMAFSSDRRYVAAALQSDEARVFQIDSWTEVARFPGGRKIAFLPDRPAILACAQEAACIWRLPG
jgi:WD40 repeat protein